MVLLVKSFTAYSVYNLNDTDLCPDDEAQGDGGVDVAPGHVPNGLGEAGHSDAEAESNSHNICLGVTLSGACS